MVNRCQRLCLLSCATLEAFSLPHGGGGCVDEASCMLNGDCLATGCVCRSGWTGPECGTLDLAPASVHSGFRSSNMSSWGGTVVGNSSTGYHLVVSRFVQNCGLKSWTTNSFVAHAVSESPLGPFHSPNADGSDEVLHPTFSHGPVVFEFSPGQYAMYQIGCGNGTTTPKQCTNGSTPGIIPQPPKPPSPAPAGGSVTGRSCDKPGWTGVSGPASSPRGPWGPPKELEILQRPDVNTSALWHSGNGVTNPSLTRTADGRVLMAYAAGLVAARGGHKHIGVAEGASWDGPFYDLTPYNPVFYLPVFENSEDPHLWQDSAGYFHIIAHTGFVQTNWKHVSAHAFSQDGANWTAAPVPPYSRVIEWEDGSQTEVFARERPQIFWENGVPVALVNGVEPVNTTMPFDGNIGYTGDWSYTHIQAFNHRGTAISV